MCLPPNAEFELKVTHPLELNSLSKWTKVNAISDLYAAFINGKMRLSFIDIDLLYRGAL
jgi:hypothetical protein